MCEMVYVCDVCVVCVFVWCVCVYEWYVSMCMLCIVVSGVCQRVYVGE